MIEKRKRGRPKKVSTLPARVHSTTSEEHQVKLDVLITEFPEFSIHEIMIIGIETLHNLVVYGFD